MVELAIRLLAAGGLILLAGLLGWDSFDTIWKVSGFICLYAFAAYAVELKGRANSGTAGIAACFDAIAICAILAATRSIDLFGYFTLAPVAYAAARYGSLPSAMAPIAAFSLLGADQWSRQGQPPTGTTLAQALGILAIGMLLNHRRIVVSVAKPVLPEHIEPLQTEEPEAYMELRESFRKLKDMYHDLERKSRLGRHAADLRLVTSGDAVRFYRRLAAQLKKLSGVDALSLYTVSDISGSMVVRAVEGSVPEEIRQSTLHISPGEALASIRNSTEKSLRALVSEENRPHIRNVVLTHRGRVVGLVSLQSDAPEKLEEAAQTIEDLAPLTSEMIDENSSKKYHEGRLRRAELLYEVASATSGAATSNALAARVVNQLSEIWDLEHISICWIEKDDCTPASTFGPNARPLEAMSFATGPGLKGWLELGAPEIVAFDVADDVRCRRAEMGKQRIQSFLLIPVGEPDRPLGYLSAASPRSGAVDVPIVEASRLVAAEFYQALLRLEGSDLRNSGLMLPGEFHRRVAEAGSGCLVYLEPLRKEDVAARYGQPAFDIALRTLAHRLRSRLPEGAAICRRAEGDYIAYLPETSEHSARSWANQSAATASLIGIPVDDHGRRVPLAIRAKVAAVGALEPESEQLRTP